MAPSLTACIAACRLALPVRMMRTALGCLVRTSARNCTPFITGMFMSETTTAKGSPFSIASRPSRGPGASVTWK